MRHLTYGAKDAQKYARCYFPSLWMDKCKAQALFSVRSGRKQENPV